MTPLLTAKPERRKAGVSLASFDERASERKAAGVIRGRCCWPAAGLWTGPHRVPPERLSDAEQLGWSRATLDSAAVPAETGCRVRPEPDASQT